VSDRGARAARIARIGRRERFLLALATVQRLADDARERGLSASAWAAEQERVMDAPRRERIRERASDMLLPDDLGEGRRPVFASEHEIGHGPRAVGGEAAPERS